MELTAHVWVYLHITAFAGAAILGLPLLQVGYIGARKDSKNWTEKNDLSGNLRGAMAEISTNQPGVLLLYSYGLKSPGHEFMGLRTGSLSGKEKENTPMSASFLWSIQSNRKK